MADESGVRWLLAPAVLLAVGWVLLMLRLADAQVTMFSSPRDQVIVWALFIALGVAGVVAIDRACRSAIMQNEREPMTDDLRDAVDAARDAAENLEPSADVLERVEAVRAALVEVERAFIRQTIRPKS